MVDLGLSSFHIVYSSILFHHYAKLLFAGEVWAPHADLRMSLFECFWKPEYIASHTLNLGHKKTHEKYAHHTKLKIWFEFHKVFHNACIILYHQHGIPISIFGFGFGECAWIIWSTNFWHWMFNRMELLSIVVHHNFGSSVQHSYKNTRTFTQWWWKTMAQFYWEHILRTHSIEIELISLCEYEYECECGSDLCAP